MRFAAAVWNKTETIVKIMHTPTAHTIYVCAKSLRCVQSLNFHIHLYVCTPNFTFWDISNLCMCVYVFHLEIGKFYLNFILSFSYIYAFI